jgi:hypothetical protein
MRDYGVTYKSVPPPPMCDDSSAIKVRYHFLRDHVEKGDIVMKYSDTERQLVDIFMKPLDVTCFASLCGGGGSWCFPSLWLGLRESLCFALYILYLVFIALHFIISIYCFTCYTSLYLVDYAYHCARVSRNEM